MIATSAPLDHGARPAAAPVARGGRARAALAALAWLVAGVACRDLPDVVAGDCGNGVLEPGEDCEPVAGGPACGAVDGPNACFYECLAEACPPGYGCGLDGRCRQAAGRFDPAPARSLSLADLAVGDVDGDGRADLIAASGTTIQVRFGSASADLATSLDVLVATPQRALAVADLDGNGAADLLVATTPGVQTFLGAADRSLDPFSYPADDFTPPAEQARAAGVLLAGSASAHQLLVAWADRIGFPRSPLPGAIAPLPPRAGGPADAALLAGLPVGALAAGRSGPGPAAALDVLLGYAGDTTVHHVRISAPPLTTEDLGVGLALGGSLVAGSAMVLGFFDGDDCLDLLAHVTGGAGAGRLVILRGTPGAAACTGALRPAVDFAPLPIDEKLLAAADLDGDGVTDLVTSERLFALPGEVPVLQGRTLALAGAAYAGAEVVDLNGDGLLDVAAFRASLPDVEVLINAGGAFNRFVVATDEPVVRLAAGDFDGDLTPDLAIVELDAAAAGARYTLGVSFGQFRGPPGERIVMHRFGRFAGLAAGHVVGPGGELDAVADLFVLEPIPDPGRLQLTVLMGSGARAMTSPLLLQAGLQLQSPDVLVVGQLDDQPGLDLLAIGDRRTVFPFTGDGAGGFASSAEPWPLPFPVGGAVWSSGDLDGDGVDEIIAVERAPRSPGAGTRLLVLAASPGVASLAVVTELDVPAGVHALELVDVDGDGDLDVLLSLDGAAGDAGGVRIGWNAGGRIARLAPLPGGDDCSDAVVLQLDGDLPPELVALCHSPGQYLLRRFDAVEPETLVASSAPLGTVPGEQRSRTRLFAGDVDGDGLVDLLVKVRRGPLDEVHVFRQLDVHAEP
jgi:hypothetical protein